MAPHRFQKGNKAALGNRGPASKRMLTSILIQQLYETCRSPQGKGEQREKMHWIVDALIGNAMRGDNSAIAFIFDRVEGKLSQQVNVDHGFDLSRLSEKELDQFEHIARKATVLGPDANAAEPRPDSGGEAASRQGRGTSATH